MESEQQRFERLWTDYLEGDLDEQGVAELRELLAENEELAAQVAPLYQTHRLLGYLYKESDEGSERFVKALRERLPKDGVSFTSEVLRKQRELVSLERAPHAMKPRGSRGLRLVVTGLAAACVTLAALLFWRNPAREAPAGTAGTAVPEVRVVRLAHARFFGELSPKLHSSIPYDKEYTLIAGMMELKFPNGAEAILESPAVFRVKENDVLVMDTGTCSVHAPPGAEGFRIDTPGSTVVDRGTRFSLKVNDSNETEIHVVEGIADVYPAVDGKPETSPSNEIRLTEKQALLLRDSLHPVTTAATFDASKYRKQLPDRIVSYRASSADDGYAEDLADVTVQRGGEVITYPVDKLIRADVVWFKAADELSSGYMMTGPKTASPAGAADPNDPACATRYDYLLTTPGGSVSPASLLADPSLLTGVINPGGSATPLTGDPVMFRNPATGDDGTPGLAIRFRQPVTNGPGPDVVFFEVQPVIYPPEGDPFHVSPLKFREGLRSRTIRNYDLNLHSSEALRITAPYVHFSENKVANSLEDLDSMKLLARPTKLVYRAVAVGIDLSDLGYAQGEKVDGLFFQDMMDDRFQIDPVFIGGLPPN
ncbi:FecR domain-containing protein [Luteolibacter sp. SL250]|uniref:FecR domain-containing protein n=1 Tax=Luteolibacter sp. SL250 TaxID=2995170 RepID=UPI00226FE002|nr:FecR domain-containing protein [Luteolibacter sp. SL250]WAC19703.1 FecR domain-containing protein [Luteolibacter sp. SL250]